MAIQFPANYHGNLMDEKGKKYVKRPTCVI